MGQAKQRGNFEERKAQSVQRKKEEREERERAAREWWESLTPEQKEIEFQKEKKREKIRQKIGFLYGLAAGL